MDSYIFRDNVIIYLMSVASDLFLLVQPKFKYQLRIGLKEMNGCYHTMFIIIWTKTIITITNYLITVNLMYF